MKESTREWKATLRKAHARELAAQQCQIPLTVEERERMQLEMEQNAMDITLIENYFASQKKLNRALYDLRFPEKEQNKSEQ